MTVPPDLLESGYSWTAQSLLDDEEYVRQYSKVLSAVLEAVPFKDGTWYTNMWPACRVESENPSVLVLGRATRGQWGERLDRADFPVDQAIHTAARKDMYWVDQVRSQYMRTALKVVESLPEEFRRNPGEPSLEISWSDLYKVAREGNPSRREMEIQGSHGAGDLIVREVEVLKPKLVLALTQSYSRNNDEVKPGWFDDLVVRSSTPPSNPNGIARVAEIAGVPCLVLPHPQAGPARQRYVDDALQALKTNF